jgi:hypothetical protein
MAASCPWPPSPSCRIVCWILIRQQAAISDKQFLRSRIPHPIIYSQQAEIRNENKTG